ncbi:hypothetical protein CVT26_011346 [Gymnopilus dilepis]|uniref:DUF8205 domain-containing protein n=1 Tax=Gymnopilus dilepis TaxID=231916 RepID=A0A409X219_9AGAR|nr:hypothetical protein CVT26_011346 [Gymnopilus dilepis]
MASKEDAFNRIILANHTISESTFQQTVTSKDDMPEERPYMPDGCSCCSDVSQNGQKLRRCSRVSMVLRLRRCQKKDWSIHKRVCKPNSDAAIIHYMISNFMANPLLVFYLQIALVLELDLIENPVIDKPVTARCELCRYPAGVEYEADSAIGQINMKQLKQGSKWMLQLKKLVALDAEEAVDAQRMVIWKEMKEKSEANGFLRAPVQVVLIEFAFGDREPGTPFALTISDAVIERMKSADSEAESAISSEWATDEQFSVKSSLSNINSYIREDKKNELRLRSRSYVH